MHKLKQDTYVDLDGNVVDERDPRVQTFVGAAGAEITDEDAKRYGLIGKKHEQAVHDEGSDPVNAADPVVGGQPMDLTDAKGADPPPAATDEDAEPVSAGHRGAKK